MSLPLNLLKRLAGQYGFQGLCAREDVASALPHAVDKFSTRQRTFWRRIRLEHARPSPRARPIHR